MNKQIDVIRKTRIYLLEQLKDLANDQLNKIPVGFNNNIIWNLGHMIATQQGICYKRAGLQTHIDDDFWEKFRSGSKPQDVVNDQEMIDIKERLISSIDQFEADYNRQIFGHYTAWATRYGLELSHIDDALAMLPYHEGLHSGVITAMKKLV